MEPSDEASSKTSQTPTPSAPQAAIPSTSEPLMSAGTKAHCQSIGKVKHHKHPLPAPYSKSKKDNPSTSSSNEKSSNHIMINAGVLVLHGESCLPNLQTLLSYIYKARINQIPIDIIYEEPNDISTQLATRMNTQLSTALCTQIFSNLSSQLQSPLRTPRSNQATQQIIYLSLLSTQRQTPHGENDTWALVPLTFTFQIGTVPGRRAASLKTQITYLGKPLNNCSININPDGWILGPLQFQCYHSPFTLTRQHPSDVYIDKTTPIGCGSMHVAYQAKVKTDLDNGTQCITNYVAKVQFIDDIPSCANNATNTQMYQYCALLLHEFKNTPLQKIQIPLIQSKIDILPQIFCHCVAVTGDINLPTTDSISHKQWADGNNAAPGIQLFLEHHKCNDFCRALNFGEVIDLQWQRPSESSEAQVPHSDTSVSLAHLLIENEKFPEAQYLFIPSQVILPIPSSVANPETNSD
ncbi:alphaK I8 [Puccinia sorghi]|uniref:AlphaK I8 n=1 Tax=Puccinia sorghi TaxID=27349 RepID=A0A0L6UTN7_9BASI|nr:alphaK I8 [Puccinia sorghi]